MRRLAGFTLIETMVYIAIVAMGMMALTFTFLASVETYSLVQGEQRILDVRRIAETHLRQRLEEASLVVIPAVGTSTSLTVDSPTLSQTPVIFARSGTVLTMKLGAAAAAPITPPDVRVTNFQTTRLSGLPASVQVDLTLETDTTRATISKTSSFTVTLRYE